MEIMTYGAVLRSGDADLIKRVTEQLREHMLAEQDRRFSTLVPPRTNGERLTLPVWRKIKSSLVIERAVDEARA